MARLRINWKLIIVLLLAAGALALTMLGLREWNRSYRVKSGIKQGQQAFDLGQWEKAAAGFGQYLAVKPDDIPVWMKYAQAQLNIRPLRSENVNEAINAYRNILRKEANSEAARRLILIFLQVQLPAEGQLIAERFLKQRSDSEIRRLLALCLVQQKQYERALEQMQNLIQQDPSQVLAYDILARIAELNPKASQFEPVQWFDQAVAANPGSARAYILRSMFLLRQNKREAALADLEKAQQCDLSDPGERISLAAGWLQADNPSKARQQLEQVLSSDPANPSLWQTWARLALGSDDKRQGQWVADEALKNLGENAESFLPLAVELYIYADRPEQAQECLEKLERMQEDTSLTAFYRGMLAESRTDWARAAGAYRQSIELGRRTERVCLKAAGAYAAMDDRTSAIQLLRTFLYQQPDSFECHLLLGRLLAENGLLAEAENSFLQALRLKPDSVRAQLLYHRAQVQRMALNPSADKQELAQLETALAEMLKQNKSVEVQLLVFETAVQSGRFEKAAEILTSLEAQNPNNSQIVLARIDLLLAQKQTQQAIGVLEDALRRFGQAPELVRTLAAALVRQKEYDRAIKVLSEAAQSLTDRQLKRRFTFWMADIASLAGNDTQASRLLLDYTNANSSDIMARRLLLNVSVKAENADFLQKQVDAIRQLEGPRGWQWRYEQARLWFSEEPFREHYPQVVALLTDNLRSNPDDRQSLLLLAASHEKAGNFRLAVTAYEEALSRNPDDIDIVIAAIGVLYRAEEYRRADEILSRVIAAGAADPRLKRFELQSCLRQGKLAPASEILGQMLSESSENRDIRLALALLKIRQGEFDAAGNLIEPILQKEPDFVPGIAVMVQSNLAQQKNDDALSLCDQTVARLKSEAAYNLRCRTYLTLGRVTDALRDVQALENLDRQNLETLLICGELYAACGKMDRAIETSQKALAKDPQSFAAQKQAAIVLLASPEHRQAGRRLLEQALSRQPKDVDLRLVKSRLLFEKETLPSQEQAVQILNDLIYEYPRMEMAWLELARRYLRQDMPGRAMDVATRGLSYLPQSTGLLLAKARAEAARSEGLAIPTLELLAQRNTEDEIACAMLGQLYLKSGQKEKAENILNTCLKEHKHKKYINVKMTLAQIMSEEGQPGRAAEMYKSLLSEDSSDPVILLNWLGILARANQWEQIPQFVIEWYKANPDKKDVIHKCVEKLASFHQSDAYLSAERIVQEILSAEPDNSRAIFAQAMLMHTEGRLIEAARMYEKTLELDSGQVVAINNLAWILCQEENQPSRALELANKGLAIEPDYVDLIDTRGMIYLTLSDYEKALPDFQRCLELYLPNRPELSATCLRMAKTLLKLGRNAEAVQKLRQAEELNQKNGGLSSTEVAELQSLLYQNMDKTSS